MKSFVKKSMAILVVIAIVSCMSFSAVSANSWLPDRGPYPGDWIGIGSTSKRLLEVMISQSRYGNFVRKTNYNYYNMYDVSQETLNQLTVMQDKVNKLYSVRIPETYFSIYKPWGTYVGAAFNRLLGFENEEWSKYPLEESDKYGAADRVDMFDFSNEDLGDISVLPNFWRWCFSCVGNGSYKANIHFIYLKFSNCGITDLSAFKNNINALKGCRIYLDGNKVTKADYEEFKKLAKDNDVIIQSEPDIVSQTSNKVLNTTPKATDTKTQKTTTPVNQISTPTVKNTTQKAKDENKGTSTGVLNGIQNIKKETNTEQKAENGGSSPKTTVTQNKSTYQPNQSITVITTETITVSSELETSSEVKGNKVILHVKITGDKAPYVAYLPSDCQVYLNGGMNSIGTVGNDGTFTYEVNKTGTYDFEIRPCTYPEGNHERVTVDDIEKPKYTLKTEYYNAKQEGGLDGIRVKLALTDNKCLKSVTFNNKKHDVSAWKSCTQAFQVTKTGDYKIRVEDRAGNVIEKTEHIVVDTSKPKVSAIKIYKNSEEIEGVCRAKIGDKLSVVISANKQIKGLRTNRITKDIIFIK